MLASKIQFFKIIFKSLICMRTYCMGIKRQILFRNYYNIRYTLIYEYFSVSNKRRR